MQEVLVDAELEVLRLLGIGVYRTRTLDDRDPIWCAKRNALLIGTDLTPDEAENVACEVLGMLGFGGA